MVYKGAGMINEDPSVEYGFMLTACDNGEGEDADADTFRIKIWEAADDTNVVYETILLVLLVMIRDSTNIGGGNIQVHQKDKKNLCALGQHQLP